MNAIFNSRAGILALVLLGGLAAVSVLADDRAPKVVVTASPDANGTPKAEQQLFFLTTPSDGQPARRTAAWLGVGVTETSEPLAAQLSLKPGEGLVVNFVASNSPAALAGLQRNDVLVDLDGQMLVDGTQLRKLVEMHAEGDSVKVTFYHAGNKQTVSAKLMNHIFNEPSTDPGSFPGNLRNLRLDLHDLPGEYGLDKQAMQAQLDVQIKQAMQAAQKAMQEARESLNGTDGASRKLEIIRNRLGDLAAGGMNLGKDSTVIVKNEGEAVRTMVKKDETGIYVIVADPASHLTAHDQDGKLLFDGTIDSPEQQEKVPKAVWKKVEPMLKQIDQDPAADSEPAPKEHTQAE